MNFNHKLALLGLASLTIATIGVGITLVGAASATGGF